MMSKRLLILSVLAALVVHPSFSSPREPDVQMADVISQVRLVQSNSLRPAKDASEVVLWLVPMQGGAEDFASAATKRHYRILQHDKMFEPKLLVVPLGSIVDFPNLDPWFHNVFSLYQGKRFDLGLYQAGAEKEVVFDRPGPSFLFCNIHPQMTAVILTVNSAFFGISDKAGHIVIPRVPAGRYAMHIWYENAASEFNDASLRPVDIEPGENILSAISVPVAKHDWAHKNKYGYDYDPKTSVPAY
jgi:plastocyanin